MQLAFVARTAVETRAGSEQVSVEDEYIRETKNRAAAARVSLENMIDGDLSCEKREKLVWRLDSCQRRNVKDEQR